MAQLNIHRLLGNWAFEHAAARDAHAFVASDGGNDNSAPDWSRVIDTVCAMAHTLIADKRTPSAQRKALSEVRRPVLVENLRSMVGPLEQVAARGTDLGLEPAVHAHIQLGIEAQARRLSALN